MAETPYRLSDVKGLLPSVEATRSDDIYALIGENYVFDTRGPRSVFGNRLLLPQKLGSPEYAQGVRIKIRGTDRSFTMAADAILEWDETAGGWQVVYATPDTSESPNRWTWAYLNEYIYFCHPRTGILVYEIATGLCLPHEEVGIATPDEAISLVVNNGFLCVVTPILFAWSNPSNGLDFSPQLGGGGFHRVSNTVSGFPIMVSSYTRGCLIWTTGGVMRSEFTGDSVVFRHRALQTEYRPVNSFCTCKSDEDTIIILDERGLFQSKGEALTPLTPLFNEFLIEYLQNNDIKLPNSARIEWDDLQRRMYISLSLSTASPKYEICFVLYPPLDKWGQFNEEHYGILPVFIGDGPRADDYFGFVDSDGRVRCWENTGWRELRPEDALETNVANLYYPPIQKPIGIVEGQSGIVLSSSAVANTFNDIEVSQQAAFYPYDGLTPIEPERTGLNSRVVLGLFRVENSAIDRLGEVISLAVRSLEEDNTYTDNGFNIDSGSATAIDLNQSVSPVSERFIEENYVNHKLRVIGSVDGTTLFDEAEPELVGFAKSIRYYSCSVVGIWHMIEVRAEAVGESYHLVSLEFGGIDAGKLN